MSLSGCQMKASVPPRSVPVQQTWELQLGDRIAGYFVSASLGDISIELDGAKVYAPFPGDVEPTDIEYCVVFSSAEVPAYLFRLCGLRRPKLGSVSQGEAIGSGRYLHFATLRRQPDGTWAIVEPSSSVLERILQPAL
ncbi:MAG: hypothetical protein HC886_22345 [Leptolyngbyaceae cyanobacterium SM1_1_3]|nr:hypothetical protein [Leptolyngbyaceae cyanobacterium SM1_1_3]NJN01090.1 hypothetical protein [Leptolyngbyaceae cyanobacterium RM1_1_2]NJO11556.1 hypothetical protein [Leptolyngbyaceae cyanobacterium SL_1_1]